MGASSGTQTRNPWGLRLWNTCAIGCAKKTAKNFFNNTLETFLAITPRLIPASVNKRINT